MITDLLFSKVGRVLVAIIVVTGLIFCVYSLGADSARNECKVADMQGQIDSLKNDLKISHAAEETARMLTTKIDKQSIVLEQKVATYETILSKVPNGDICGLNADDVKRMRDIK